jgi:hypothetical protein
MNRQVITIRHITENLEKNNCFSLIKRIEEQPYRGIVEGAQKGYMSIMMPRIYSLYKQGSLKTPFVIDVVPDIPPDSKTVCYISSEELV